MTTPTRTPPTGGTATGPTSTAPQPGSTPDPMLGIVGAPAPLLFVLEFTDHDGNVTGGFPLGVPARTPEDAIRFAECNGAGTAHVRFTGIVLIHRPRHTTGQEAA